MAATMKELGIDRLSLDERLALMQEIWESIATEPGPSHLSDSQKRDLQQRLADHKANPTDTIGWEQVKADTLARLKQ
jgi:putative addiction module component (TIGR02574 family)